MDYTRSWANAESRESIQRAQNAGEDSRTGVCIKFVNDVDEKGMKSMAVTFAARIEEEIIWGG